MNNFSRKIARMLVIPAVLACCSSFPVSASKEKISEENKQTSKLSTAKKVGIRSVAAVGLSFLAYKGVPKCYNKLHEHLMIKKLADLILRDKLVNNPETAKEVAHQMWVLAGDDGEYCHGHGVWSQDGSLKAWTNCFGAFARAIGWDKWGCVAEDVFKCKNRQYNESTRELPESERFFYKLLATTIGAKDYQDQTSLAWLRDLECPGITRHVRVGGVVEDDASTQGCARGMRDLLYGIGRESGGRVRGGCRGGTPPSKLFLF